MSSNQIPFTATKFAELQAEKNKLEAERVLVMQRLQTAREMGDLSENGAYKYAKFELGNIGRQLRVLNYQLENGYVPVHEKNGTVQFGSTVTLTFKNKEKDYLMVSEFESDPSQGKLGITSPLGKLLIGKKVGDEIELVAPAGVVKYKVVAIK